MRRPVIVVRPEPGCSETVEAAHDRGLSVVGAPLFVIEPVSWRCPPADEFDGVLAGSANAFRHGGPDLARLTSLPVHAVGGRTAMAARESGFGVASVGEGGLQSVLEAIAAPARLLRLAGEARAPLRPPHGLSVVERVVYRANARSLSADAVGRLVQGAVVLLHSGEAARAFATECERSAIRRDLILIAALAPRIAEAAGPGWGEVRVASATTDSALLALAEDMCQ